MFVRTLLAVLVISPCLSFFSHGDSSAQEVPDTVTVTVQGSGGDVKEYFDEWGWQRITYSLEVDFQLTASSPVQVDDAVIFSSLEVTGTLHFYGSAEDHYYGSTEIFNFDRTYTFEGPLPTSGEVLFSTSECRILGLWFSFPPPADYPKPRYLDFFGDSNTIRATIDMPYPWSVGYISNEYDISGTAVSDYPDCCQDQDGDGHADTVCGGADCVDDPSADPPECSTCACGEPECTRCARCINPGAAEDIEAENTCGDTKDNDCDGLPDGEDPDCPALHAVFVGMYNNILINANADARAMYAHFQKYSNWAADTNPVPIIFSSLSAGPENKELIQSTLSWIESNTKPGDYFIFYYAGDGGYFNDTEPDETPSPAGNNSDECLHLSNERDVNLAYEYELTDDALKAMLDSPAWNEVYKWVILDTCHSGGFAGDHNVVDTGDLEKLPRMALSAATDEDGKAGQWPWPGPKWGRGLFTIALLESLEKAPSVNVAELQLSLNEWDVTDLIGEEVYVREKEHIVDEPYTVIFDPSYWEPQTRVSDDFEIIFPQNDLDGDGIYDHQDNCHTVSNPDQTDADDDGYGEVCDCNDSNVDINPSVSEVCRNEVDDNCDGSIDEGCGYSATANAMASTYGSGSLVASGSYNALVLLLIPVGAVIFLRIWRRKR